MFDDEFEENIDDLAALEEEINRENADMNVEEEVEDFVMSVEGSLTSMKETEIVTTRPTGRPTTTSARPSTKSAAELASIMQAARNAVVGHSTVASLNRDSRALFAKCGALMKDGLRIKTIPFSDCVRFLSLTPIDSNVYNDTIILYCGRRYFLRERKPMIPQIRSDNFNPSVKNLLPKSFRDLQFEVDDEIKVKSSLFQTQLQRSSISNEQESNGLGNAPQLWVDKYSPQSFTQLLSVEKTNREVLKAVKRWDRYVFKIPPIADSSAKGTAGNEQAASLSLYAEDGRPRQKVIMLCGPPGTGKTTLAHVAAKHCGYRAVEINASDDRSPEALRELLARATQSTTLDADKRPNCIIFDEADGIADSSKQSLEILLDVIKAPLSAANKGKKRGKNSKDDASSNAPFALTRPLIVICNDQYAPVLRELKQLAEVFIFQAPSEMRLVQRLKHICALEGIQIRNSSLLSELIHVTGHDIRSTINNLQFAAMRLKQQDNHGTKKDGNSDVDLKDVVTSMMNMGLKDDNLDSFQVWQRIFTASTASGDINNKKKQEKSEMMVAIDSMQQHGDYEHLIHGMHENLHQTASDHSTTAGGDILSRFAYSADWLSMSDMMMTSMRNLSDGFQLMPYVALTAGAVHMSHAITITRSSQGIHGNNAGNGESALKLQWPKKDRDAHFARQQRINVLQAMQEQQTLHQHRSPETKENIAMDYAAPLLDVFVPKARPLPMLSLSPQEKENVLHTVQLMESCGVAYIPMAVVDRPDGGKKFGGRNNKFNPPPPPSKTKGKSGVDTENIFLQDRVEFQLEPRLDLLVSFDTKKCDELVGRHVFIPQEVRAVIYQEQRQLSIARKEVKSAVNTKSAPSAETTNNSMIVDENNNDTESRLSAPQEGISLSKRAAVASLNGRDFDEEDDGRAQGGLLSSFLVKKRTSGDVGKPAAKKSKVGSGDVKIGSFVDLYQRGQKEKKQAAYFGFNKGFNAGTASKTS